MERKLRLIVLIALIVGVDCVKAVNDTNPCLVQANQIWTEVVGYGAMDPNPTSNQCIKSCISSNPTQGDEQLHCLNANCSDGLTQLWDGSGGQTNTYGQFLQQYNSTLKACNKFASCVQKVDVTSLPEINKANPNLTTDDRNGINACTFSCFITSPDNNVQQDPTLVNCLNTCFNTANVTVLNCGVECRFNRAHSYQICYPINDFLGDYAKLLFNSCNRCTTTEELGHIFSLGIYKPNCSDSGSYLQKIFANIIPSA